VSVMPGFESFVPHSEAHTASKLREGDIIGLQFYIHGYVRLARIVALREFANQKSEFIEVCYSWLAEEVWLSDPPRWKASENEVPNGFITFMRNQWVTTYRDIRDSAK
jgi:hypothetical protein